MKNKYLPNWIICLTELLPQDMLDIKVVFYLVWNLFENVYIYGLSSTRVSLKTLYITPRSLNLFIHVPFQLPEEHTA